MLLALLGCYFAASELQYILQISSIKVTTQTVGCGAPVDAKLRFDVGHIITLSDFALDATVTQQLPVAFFAAVSGQIAPVLILDGVEYPISVVRSRSFDIEVCFKDLVLTVADRLATVSVEPHCVLNPGTRYYLMRGDDGVLLTAINDSTYETRAFAFSDWQTTNIYFAAVTGADDAYFLNLIVYKHAVRLSKEIYIYWNEDQILVGLSLFVLHEGIDTTGFTGLDVIYYQQLSNYQAIAFTKHIADIAIEWDAILEFSKSEADIYAYKQLIEPYGMLYLNYHNGSSTVIYSQYCQVVKTAVKDVTLGVARTHLYLRIYALQKADLERCYLILASGTWTAYSRLLIYLPMPIFSTAPGQYAMINVSSAGNSIDDFYAAAVRRKGESVAAIECPELLYYITKFDSIRYPTLYPFAIACFVVAGFLAPALWLYFGYFPRVENQKQLQILEAELKRREEEEARLAQAGVPRQNLFYKDLDIQVQSRKIFTDIETVNGIQGSARARATQGSDTLRSIGEGERADLPQPSIDGADIDAEFEELERQLDEMKADGLEDQDIE